MPVRPVRASVGGCRPYDPSLLTGQAGLNVFHAFADRSVRGHLGIRTERMYLPAAGHRLHACAICRPTSMRIDR